MVKDNRLKWDRLLSTERQRNSISNSSTNDNSINNHRNEFEADYDRIVGSSSVRRLQDKAQVFPLQQNDVVRTRLTHSLEVSSIARSLGKAVGMEIIEQKKDPEFKQEYISQVCALLQTAGLIHDLGNPPFGHYGETVIRDWFSKWFEDFESIESRYHNIFKEELRILPEQKTDYIYFDGNVQNIRIVTKLQALNDRYGANFTYGTLATLIKYPWRSNTRRTEEKGKYGYFYSESDIVGKIYNSTGLKENVRHPLTYLLEAADDITYICDDIEDGVKKSVINWKIEYSNIMDEIDFESEEDFKSIDDKMKKFREKRKEEFGEAVNGGYSNFPEDILSDVRNFRNIVQGKLIFAARDKFLEMYDEIMSGTFGEKELLGDKKWKKLCDAIKNVTRRNCYNCKEVLSLELVGDKVIRTLLETFVGTLIFSNKDQVDDTRTYEGKLYSIISSNYKFINCINCLEDEIKPFDKLSIYERIQLCVDFISGMTDSYAVNLYKQLLGVELP